MIKLLRPLQTRGGFGQSTALVCLHRKLSSLRLLPMRHYPSFLPAPCISTTVPFLSPKQTFSTASSEADTPQPLFRVAIVGAGPSGFYTAKYILQDYTNTQVDIFDCLPTPFGLVRSGVAPGTTLQIQAISTNFVPPPQPHPPRPYHTQITPRLN